MKLTLLTIADASNDSGGKTNALGMGVRVVTPQRFPAVTPLVLLAIGQAANDELGEQPVRITLETPTGRRSPLVEDTVTVSARPTEEEQLPIEVKVALSFPFLTESEGLYTFRMQLGKARGSYAVITRLGERAENPSPDQ